MAEAEYVARLVAHLRSKPSRSNLPSPEHNYTDLLPSLGNAVRRPDGVPSLGNVLRRHPHIFRLHAVGASDAVSLVSGAPSRPKGRKAESHAEVEPANLAAAIKDALQEAEKEQVEQNEQIEEARRSYFESHCRLTPLV